jgi:hypothetical protein
MSGESGMKYGIQAVSAQEEHGETAARENVEGKCFQLIYVHTLSWSFQKQAQLHDAAIFAMVYFLHAFNA